MSAIAFVSQASVLRASVVLSLDIPINGDNVQVVDGSKPALTATFTDLSQDKVQLVLDATNLNTHNFLDDWVLNSDVDATTLTFSYTTSSIDQVLKSSSQSLNGGQNMKAGLFNIDIHFFTAGNKDRFYGGETIEILIEGAGLTESSFLKTSIASGNVSGGWYSAAHVQGIQLPGGGTGSGSIGAMTTVQPVPEPSTMVLSLVGAGLLGLRLVRRRRA
jgi:hypothetical protein